MNIDTNVQNGTTDMFNKAMGNSRVVKTQGSLELKHYISDCERLINEFTDFAVKTAKSTLEMCRVVHDAKNMLTKDEFLKFCEGIGHKTEDSTIRKYLIIGANYERLIKYADLLPNSWTSIYALTQLPPEVFQAHALTGTTMANMTGAQIKALMAPPASAEKPNSPRGESAIVPPQQAQSTAQSNAAAECEDRAGAAAPRTSAASASANSERACTSSQSSLSVPAASVDEGEALSSAPSAEEFAKQATSKVVADACAASKRDAVEGEQAFVPYGIVLRFNSKPPEAAAKELTEMLIAIKAKYRLDLAILNEEPALA